VARILIVGGGCRGRALAAATVAGGHAVRITTRDESGRPAIEDAGAECYVGTPARLATMRGALDGATILCWLLVGASGPGEELAALHTTRLEFFMRQAVDTTVRGVVYETGPDPLVREGERLAREAAATHSIPLAVLAAPVGDIAAWLGEAQGAIEGLLGG
jgi:hypothetical protein